jgi:hypothetical protein
MVKQASLFSQVLCLVDRHHFEREVRRWNAERHAKGFSCWSQFVAMMFCQLAQAKSLREIVDGISDGYAQVRRYAPVFLQALELKVGLRRFALRRGRQD